MDPSSSASRLLEASTRASASNTARRLASAIRTLCLSNLQQRCISGATCTHKTNNSDRGERGDGEIT